MLQAKGIYKNYGTLPVLKGVDLEVKEGEVVSIVGSSGAGKSTLLHIAGTLDTPDKGEVYINNTNVTALSGNKLSAFRNKHIGFIFQFHHLLPEFTAFENVCMPGYISSASKSAVEKRAKELLETMGLAHRLEHKPSQMSGGEQQRVSVARALINNPDIVFADEPTGNLDSHLAEEMHELFFKLRDAIGQTFLIVTHNNHLADLCDRKLVMKDGLFVTE